MATPESSQHDKQPAQLTDEAEYEDYEYEDYPCDDATLDEYLLENEARDGEDPEFWDQVKARAARDLAEAIRKEYDAPAEWSPYDDDTPEILAAPRRVSARQPANSRGAGRVRSSARGRERAPSPETKPRAEELAGCGTPAATRIVDLVAALGAIPLRAAVRIGDLLDGCGEPALYKASQRLDETGVIRRLQIRGDLNLNRVTGVATVLVAGSRWEEWIRRHSGATDVERAATAGCPRIAPRQLSVAAPDVLVHEQLALAMALLARILAGWKLARSDVWLDPAAQLLLKRLPPFGPSVALARSLARGAHKLDPTQHLVGLLPPPMKADERLYHKIEQTRFATIDLPCVVVGGTWSTRTDVTEAAEKLRYASPFALLATARSETDAERLRKLARDSEYAPGTRDRVFALRTDRFESWNRAAKELERTFRSTPDPDLRAHLRGWLYPEPRRD